MGVSDAGRGTRTCRENGVREGSEGSLHQVFRNRENVTWLGAGFMGGRREQTEAEELSSAKRVVTDIKTRRCCSVSHPWRPL